MVHLVHPFRQDKNLGRAYNEAFRNCPDGDWLCLMDWDVLLLTHDAVGLMNGYVEKYPDTGIFTCYTNRIHAGAKDQLLGGVVSENTDIRYHIQLAEDLKNVQPVVPDVVSINHHISGMLMLISKETWKEINFFEDKKCLGVDNQYSDRILNSGRRILRMERIYVFHIYRLMQGVRDKSHLL